MAGKKKKFKAHECYPGAFTKAYQWKIDYDYVEKLSPEEREWLAEFGKRYYRGEFKDADETEWPRAVRTAVYRASNFTRRSEAYAHSIPVEVPESLPEAAREWHETPEYLETDEYRAAVEEFRAKVDRKEATRPLRFEVPTSGEDDE